jgi:NAD-dependent deacetylase
MAVDRAGVAAAADLMVARTPAVALTGAGASVESGIPDFRSAGGLWERFDPIDYATIDAFLADPDKVWTMLRELGRTLAAAQPNAGHSALARLERLGALAAVITQNIDDLHQRSGSRRVIEFHGNASRLLCLRCGRTCSEPPLLPPTGAPRCEACGAALKPDVVLFGEPIPSDTLREASELCCTCQVMLVVGTSGMVEPAASLPRLARGSGAAIVEVNVERTPLTQLAEVSIRGQSGEVLPLLADAVAERLEP